MELRETLEYLADRIEAILCACRCPGKIVGGTVGLSGVSFVLQPMPGISYSQVQAALNISMERSNGGIVLMLPINNQKQLEVSK